MCGFAFSGAHLVFMDTLPRGCYSQLGGERPTGLAKVIRPLRGPAGI